MRNKEHFEEPQDVGLETNESVTHENMDPIDGEFVNAVTSITEQMKAVKKMKEDAAVRSNGV